MSKQEVAGAKVDPDAVDRIVSSWPPTPQKVARTIIEKYGDPHEVTASALFWYDVGPWKRTILYRDEVPHRFPKPHTDVLEQFIDYRVPVDKFSELAAYDGSVIVARTKGEMSARCDKEEMNFLALNLANDVVIGARSVEDARRTYAENAMAAMKGETPPYVQKLGFEIHEEETGDPDSPMLG